MIWSYLAKGMHSITIKRHKTQVLNYFTELLGGHFNNAAINESLKTILQEIF